MVLKDKMHEIILFSYWLGARLPKNKIVKIVQIYQSMTFKFKKNQKLKIYLNINKCFWVRW